MYIIDNMAHSSNESLKQKLRKMDPYEFEKLVAEIWELEGYTTTVRSGSADRGIDIEAIKELPVEQKVLIQAKRYSENNKVGAEEVRNYATLYQQVSDADSVVIVSTSEFTAEGKKIGREQNVKIVNVDSLLNLIKKHKKQLSHLNQTNEIPDRDELIRRAEKQKKEERKKRRKKKRESKKIKHQLERELEQALYNLSEVKISWSDQHNRASEVRIDYSNDERTYRDIASIVKVGPELRRIDFEKIKYINGVDKRNEDFEIILRTERENTEEVNIELSIIDEVLRRAEAGFSYLEFPE